METTDSHTSELDVSTIGALQTVLSWVSACAEATPVDESWVPGARIKERTQLGALGSLVGSALRVMSINAPAFETGNLSWWVRQRIVGDDSAVHALQTLLNANAELNLAAVYSSIVSGRSRRTLGTFFTPADEANWMVRAWEQRFPAPRTVIDVGAGVGVFSLRAAEAWPKADVLAIDVNPVTLGLLVLCERAQNAACPSAKTGGRVVAIEADFTRWVDTTWERTPGPRLVLGNPPYTRLQLMPPGDRARLTAAGGGLVGSRAALSAIITAQSLRVLNADDGLALLLPAQWLEADYAQGLRQHLWDQTHRRVELRIFGEQLFADATVDAVALLVGPVESGLRPLTVSAAEGRRVAAHAREVTDVAGFAGLIAAARSHPTVVPSNDSYPLSAFATVRRGAATGANKFFVLDQTSVAKHRLGAELLTPLLRRTRSAPDALTDSEFDHIPSIDRRWLLLVRREQIKSSEPLRQYLADGEAAGIPTGYLCKVRTDWFDLHHDVSIPDVIVGQASKETFKIIENRMGAAIANNLYGMRWLRGTTESQRHNIMGWLRSGEGQSALRAAARVQASGLLKLEPRALANVRVPASVTVARGPREETRKLSETEGGVGWLASP